MVQLYTFNILEQRSIYFAQCQYDFTGSTEIVAITTVLEGFAIVGAPRGALFIYPGGHSCIDASATISSIAPHSQDGSHCLMSGRAGFIDPSVGERTS